MDLDALKRYLVARLQEPSTWRGLILIATAAGAKLSPQQVEAILTGGILLAGLVAVAFPDRRPILPPPAPKDDGQDSGV